MRTLFDHLVGAGQDGRRDRNGQRARRAKIDREPDLGRLLEWKIGNRRAFHQAVDVAGGSGKIFQVRRCEKPVAVIAIAQALLGRLFGLFRVAARWTRQAQMFA